MIEPIENKVAKSSLVTIDLQKFHDSTPIDTFDLKDYLYQGLILRENDLRKGLEEHDWARYAGNYLTVYCSSDAIIPSWAYMLVATHVRDFVKEIFFGKKEDVVYELYRRKIEAIDWDEYAGKRVILKGCSDIPVPASAYLLAAKKLLPRVERLMYGEACSFVPVFRQPANKN